MDKYLSTGCVEMDNFFGGGIPTTGIVEIGGESGTGKTQIALQLCITVQLPRFNGGLDGGALYIYTDGPFPSSRLHQMCEHFKGKFPKSNNPMDRILLRKIFTGLDLLKCLSTEVPLILNSSLNIRLLVIDSIAGPIRPEYGPSVIHLIGSALGKLEKSVMILCVNQVSGTNSETPTFDIIPSLGHRWTQILGHRFLFTRTTDGRRRIRIVFSKTIPTKVIQFIIKEEGVFGINVFSTVDTYPQTMNRIVPVSIKQVLTAPGTHLFTRGGRVDVVCLVGSIVKVDKQDLWIDDHSGIIQCQSLTSMDPSLCLGDYVRVIGTFTRPPKILIKRVFKLVDLNEITVHILEVFKFK